MAPTWQSIADGIRRLLRPAAARTDLDDEVSQFLESAARDYMSRGLSRADAERAARVDFGGVEAAKDSVRESGWDGAVASFARDVIVGARGLRRAPTFAVVACLTLALGIGATTAMFTVIDAVILRPLPYADPGRLALIWTDDVRRGLHEERTAYRTILDWRSANRTLRDIAFYTAGRAPLGNDGVREMTRAAYVSGNLFTVLGARTAIGRPISVSDEDHAEPVAVISYSLWQRRFAGDSNIVGKLLDAEDLTNDPGVEPRIIGVMPRSFYFPDKLTEVWVPATTYWRFRRESTERFPDWARRWIAIGRLRPSATVADTRGDLRRIGERLASLYRADVPDFPGFATNVVPILDHVTGQNTQRALWLLLGAVGIVLLVACANVANLLLARAAAREHEMAVRRALGAGRGRLVRQLLAENTVLALSGGVLGLLVALALTRVVATTGASHVARIDEASFDVRVFVFALALTTVAGLAFGILPAVRASSVEAGTTLRSTRASARGSARRMRELLVIVECALAVVLLIGAGLLLRSLARVQGVSPGFDATNVLSMRLILPAEAPPSAEERLQTSKIAPARARAREGLLENVARQVAGLPGVHDVGFIDDMFTTSHADASITIPGRPADAVGAGELNDGSVSPGFFATLRVPLRAGRLLTASDAETKIHALWTPVVTDQSLAAKERNAIAEPVVVNESFVRRFFPSEDPIGKRFCVDPTNKTYWYQIVGVIGDMHRQGLEHATIPEYFGPYVPPANGRVDLLVRSDRDEPELAASARRLVQSGIPGVLIPTVSTAARQLGEFSAERRLQTLLLAAFAALALTLAMIGVYGVLHYAIAERTNEIGIRVALGATPADVAALALRDGLRLPAIGLAIGAAASAGLTRVLEHLLFETQTSDAATYVGVITLLGLSGLVAAYLPARRAAAVDPITALRL